MQIVGVTQKKTAEAVPVPGEGTDADIFFPTRWLAFQGPWALLFHPAGSETGVPSGYSKRSRAIVIPPDLPLCLSPG